MRLKIKDIAVEGDVYERVLGHDEVEALLAASTVELSDSKEAAARLALRLEVVDDSVVARGTLAGHFDVPCARCLAPARIVAEELALIATFVPAETLARASEEEETELTAEDLDTYVHDGESIDLEPLVREYLVLAIPIAPLCRDDCAGLCSRCGANQNEAPCECSDEPAAESSWVAALKGIKESMS